MSLQRSPYAALRWWLAFAAVLVAAPLCFSQSASISLLSQIATAMLLALSYNLLLGQGGMLSFGHAVYAGLGGYATIHMLNLLSRSVEGGPGWLSAFAWLPAPLQICLLPLAGGLAAAAVALLFGFIAARRAGMVFSMITLGIAELVAAGVTMFPDWFGGEGGLSGNRVYGSPLWGVDFSTPLQLYYLIAAWLFAAALAMYGFMSTPLGRLLNAVRDNPQRVEFIGYDPRRVRYLAQIAAALFAGMAGALAALNFEIVSPENVGPLQSAGILLFTFIGGTAFFYGPMLGALIGVLFSVQLARYSSAWQLYLGLFFIVIVLRAPGGVASLLQTARLRVAGSIAQGRRERWQAAASMLVWLAAALLAMAGLVLLVELATQRAAGSAYDSTVHLGRMQFDSDAAWPWWLGVLLAGAGGFCLHLRTGKDRTPDTAEGAAAAWPVPHGPAGAVIATATATVLPVHKEVAGISAIAEISAVAEAGTTANRVPALVLSGVNKRYGHARIVTDCNLQVKAGLRYAIIGPNGAGKSTLLDLVSGRSHCDSGSIVLFGREVRRLAPARIHRRGLSRSFQITSLFPALSVFDNLRCATLWSLGYRYTFWRRLRTLRDANNRTRQLLQQLGLESQARLPAGSLTYAEQRMVEIGICIAGDADLLLLDEPTAGMDRTESAAMVALIRRVTAGKTLLMIEHDMQVVFELADMVAVMVDGSIVACDTPERIRNDPAVQRHYLAALP